MFYVMSVDYHDQKRSLAGRGFGELRDLGIAGRSYNTRLLIFLRQHTVTFVRSIPCLYDTYISWLSHYCSGLLLWFSL